MQWSERTWEELPDDLVNAASAAILPVGATEQHGPHLGCGVDAVLADRLCAAVASRAKIPVLPTLPYGCSLGHSRRWPGTLAVKPGTLIDFVKEIGDWAYYSRRAASLHRQHACDQRGAICAARWKCCGPSMTT